MGRRGEVRREERRRGWEHMSPNDIKMQLFVG